MKKIYMTPQTEVYENVITTALCDPSATQDPGSGGNEGSEDLARENVGYENYPLWEEE